MQNRIVAVFGGLTLVAAVAACSETPVGPASADSPTLALAQGSGSGGGSTDARVETSLLATSTAYPKAKGRARFRDRGGERELQIEVENLRPGLTVTFLFDGAPLTCTGGVACSAVVDGFGNVRINLNTDGGPGVAGTSVPASVSGRTVAAAVGGQTVARGTFN